MVNTELQTKKLSSPFDDLLLLAGDGTKNVSIAGVLNLSYAGTTITTLLAGGTNLATGSLIYVTDNSTKGFIGIYDSSNGLYYGIANFTGSLTVNGKSASTLGGYYGGLGITGTTNGGVNPIFGVLTSTQSLEGIGHTAFTIQDGNQIYTFNSTLDDGSGNAGFTKSGAGIVSVNGIKTTAGAATTVTVGTSPYTYSNSSSSNQQLFIQGGTVSAISFKPNGGTGISLSGLTDNVFVVRPGDTVVVTYTAAPTMTTIQL